MAPCSNINDEVEDLRDERANSEYGECHSAMCLYYFSSWETETF